MKKRYVFFGVALLLTGILFGAFLTLNIAPVLDLYGSIGVAQDTNRPPVTLHGKIEFWKEDTMLYAFVHPGAVTKLGYNLTLAKLSGNSAFSLTFYAHNTTWLSIGDQGTLTNSSTTLPGEWNVTAGSVGSLVVSGETYSFNVTATMYPDSSGPYTADCFGVNYNGTEGSAGNWLFGYDTFTQVTGIDETFTINLEMQISITYS